MSDFLPQDVLIDVLARLPIKTLVRFACVCKSWYSVVSNPSFITRHLTRSSLSNNNNLLLVRSHSANRVKYSLLSCENKMVYDYTELALPLKSNKNYLNPYLRIIGSCNGLVCLFNDLHSYEMAPELYLWNPSIQKTLALPPLRVTFQSPVANFIHSIGFGFHSLTNDYKVIRIVYLYDRAIGFQTPPEVDIFSLSTSTWRNISHLGLPHSTIYTGTPQAYLNGAAHWLAYDNRKTMRNSTFFYLIVSFHMGDEVFGEIMVPVRIFRDYSGENVHLAKFQESLSLVACLWGQDCCCIWVMKEYGIYESWTKQFNIDMYNGLFKSVAGFTRKGEVLFGTEQGYLVAYDPEARRGRVMHLHSLGSGYGDSFYVDEYAESLALL